MFGIDDVFTNIFNQSQARRNAGEANDWANEAAGVNRAWQEKMSNSAHQREVIDLKKAGLNPVLSGTGGSGSSTPGGATASSAKADTVPLNNIIHSALEARNMQAQNALLKAQEGSAATASEVNKATVTKLGADTDKTKKETAILSPSATFWQKIDEGMKSGSEAVKKGYDSMKESVKKRRNQEQTAPPVFNKSYKY